jgi:hypothetical protein
MRRHRNDEIRRLQLTDIEYEIESAVEAVASVRYPH